MYLPRKGWKSLCLSCKTPQQEPMSFMQNSTTSTYDNTRNKQEKRN